MGPLLDMKRVCVYIAAALALGMATSVAIAWTIALTTNIRLYSQWDHEFAGYDRRVLSDDRTCALTASHGPGVWLIAAIVESADEPDTVYEEFGRRILTGAPRFDEPWWMPSCFPHYDTAVETRQAHVIRAVGWPAPSLVSGFHAEVDWNLSPSTPIHVLSAIPLETSADLIQPPRALPVQPVWIGLGANSGLFGTTFLFVFVVIRVTRRVTLTRHGRCPCCAYPVGGSFICSECGCRLRGSYSHRPSCSETMSSDKRREHGSL